MLGNSVNDLDQHRLAEQITAYVSRTLRVQIKLDPLDAPPQLPVFIGRAYRFFEAYIAGRSCLLMLTRHEIDTPGDIAKHMRLVGEVSDKIVIAGVSALSARDRSRLIGQGVSFIVPGNQFYVPELGMDLREHYRAQKLRPADGLSPAAQAVLFHHMLRRNEMATTPSDIARDLRYSSMSIGRAFDDLAAVGLAVTEKSGRERHLRFREDRRDMMESVRTLLRSPVKSRKLVWGPHSRPSIKRGGESALSELTDLSPPKLVIYAIAATDWKGFAASFEYRNDGFEAADFALETWSYDPAGLSDTDIVDPLSLYAQFWNHEDERISMAAEQLLEHVPW